MIIMNIVFFLVLLSTWVNAWKMNKLKELDLTVENPEQLIFYIFIMKTVWLGVYFLVLLTFELSVPMLICEILILGNVFGNNAIQEAVQK